MTLDSTLYLVTLHYATYGLLVDKDNVVVHAPPIAKWMKGKHLINDVIPWVTKKRGSIEAMPDC